MEPLSRVDFAEDPYFAVRNALGVVLTLLLAEPFGIAMPTLAAALALSLLSGQRGKFDMKRALGPLAIPVLAYVFAYLAGLTAGDPGLFVVLFLALALLAFFLTVIRGSNGGLMLLMVPTMMSVMSVANDQAMVLMRDSMASTGIVLAMVLPVVNLILPPHTDRVHVPKPDPQAFANPALEIVLRTAIFGAVLVYTFAAGDTNLLIMPVMTGFVLMQGGHNLRREEAIQRVSATVIGAVVALLAILTYRMLPQLPVLFAIVALITLFFSDRMITGRLPPVTYQFSASVALVVLLTSIGTRDAMEVIVQRIAVSTIGATLAITALALSEAALRRWNESDWRSEATPRQGRPFW